MDDLFWPTVKIAAQKMTKRNKKNRTYELCVCVFFVWTVSSRVRVELGSFLCVCVWRGKEGTKKGEQWVDRRPLSISRCLAPITSIFPQENMKQHTHTHTLGSVAYTNADGEKKQENREKWNRFNYTERERVECEWEKSRYKLKVASAETVIRKSSGPIPLLECWPQ